MVTKSRPSQPAAGGLGRDLGPAHGLVAVGDGELAARRGDRAVEPVALDQHRRLAVAEIGEAAVAAVGQQLGALVAQLLVDIDGLVQIQRRQDRRAAGDPLAVLVLQRLAGAEQQGIVALHGGGLAHRDPGIDLQREAVRIGLLQRPRGGQQLVPAGRLPALGLQPGLREHVAAVVDDADIGALGQAVALALVGHQRLGAGRDVRPAVPAIDLGPGDLVERLQQAALDEAGDQEAVEAGDVGPGAGGEVERQLLRQLLIGAAEALQRHGVAGAGRAFGEFGDDPGLDPGRQLGVHAALDAAADDRQVGGVCRRAPGQGREQAGGENPQAMCGHALCPPMAAHPSGGMRLRAEVNTLSVFRQSRSF